MKKISVSHTRRWLMLFLALVIVTTIATYLIAYVEIIRTLLVHNTPSGIETDAVIQKSNLTQLSGLKIRLLLLMSIAIFLVCILGYVWVGLATRQLNRPLRMISNAISRMAKGKLNATVTVDAQEEFSQIATNINELAANLQELLLYIWKQSWQCLEQLEQLKADLVTDGNDSMSPAHIDRICQIYKSVEDLRNMAKAYVFFDVHLKGENALSISELGHTIAADNDHSKED